MEAACFNLAPVSVSASEPNMVGSIKCHVKEQRATVFQNGWPHSFNFSIPLLVIQTRPSRYTEESCKCGGCTCDIRTESVGTERILLTILSYDGLL